MAKETEIKVRIRRVDGKPPATCISYPALKKPDGSPFEGVAQWFPEEGKTEFEVEPIIAQFAIESGLFEEAPDSRAKLKTPPSLPSLTRSNPKGSEEVTDANG